MDWTVVEKLAPSLAWPAVFLIALPFIIWHADKLIESLGHARELSDKLPDLFAAIKNLDRINDKLDLLRKNSDTIINTIDASDKQREAESSDLAELSTAIVDAAAPPIEPEQLIPKGADKMFASMTTAWTSLTDALDEAYARAKLGAPDKRSIGTAARRLADGRRKKPISWDEVDRLSNLHSLYKRFLRMKADRDKHLNAEVYMNFISGVRQSRQALENFG